MAEYIEREALLSKIEALPEQERIETMKIYDCIRSIPSADVAEVRHGKWIEHIEVGYSGAKYFRNNCSVCRCLALKKDSEKYCHNCGAKMDL